MWLYALALTSALAGALSAQQVAELEWSRAPTSSLAPALASDDAALRAQAARALGRIGRPDAVPVLQVLLGDPDLGVATAAAEALALVPTAAPALREALDARPPPAAGLLPGDDPVRVALLRGLGRQGDASDVARLIEALGEPGPAAVAAAHALSDLGRAEVEGLSAAARSLSARLSAPRLALSDASAHALRRTGLEGADAETVAVVRAAAMAGPTVPTRAWATTAVWPALDRDARQALLTAALADEPMVAAAALDSVGAGEVPLDMVIGALDEAGPWARAAAAAALGRLADPGAVPHLERVVESWPPRQAAIAVGALAALGALPAIAPDAERAVVAAIVAHGPVELAREQLDAPDALVRTSAATRLGEEPVAADVARMLASPDPAVREAGVDAATRCDGGVALLVAGLASEVESGVLGAALDALAGLEPAPSARAVAPLVARGLAHANPRVQRIAARLGGQDPDASAAEPGDVGAWRAPAAELDAVAGLQSAVLSTSQGEIVVALRPDLAPLAVARIAELADADFFDGLVFHRVVPGFVAQTGCPRGDGWGGPGDELPDEVSFAPYTAGAVGIARSGPDTGGSQWFISTAPTPHLEGRYTLVGQVVRGLEVARSLAVGDTVVDLTVERVHP